MKKYRILEKFAAGEVNVEKTYYKLYPKEKKELSRFVKFKVKRKGHRFLKLLLLLPISVRILRMVLKLIDIEDFDEITFYKNVTIINKDDETGSLVIQTSAESSKKKYSFKPQRMQVLWKLANAELTVEETKNRLEIIDASPIDEIASLHLRTIILEVKNSAVDQNSLQLTLPAKHVTALVIMNYEETFGVEMDKIIAEIIAGETGVLVDVKDDSRHLKIKVI